MGNCATNQRIEESESDTCYVFKVGMWDSTKSSVIHGTLRVMESGLEFTSPDKDVVIECTWHHVCQFACDGKAFTCSVRCDHYKEQYWFSCENVAVLFLRFNNYIIRVNESEQQKKVGTSEDSVSKPEAQATRRKKKGSRGSSKSGSGSVRNMSPLLETADNASKERIKRSSDGNQTNRSQSSSYVNLTPYINITPADSPLPPPLPPKGIKSTSILTRQLSSATVTCTLCIDKPKAVTYCYECLAFVCLKCAKQHLRMVIFANHNLFVRKSDSPVARRKSTGCKLTTVVKYADVIFQEASEEQSPHSDPEPFNQSKLRHTRALSCGSKDLIKVDYSKIDFEKTKDLSELKHQRMHERTWSAKERRASMGNRHTSKVSGSI